MKFMRKGIFFNKRQEEFVLENLRKEWLASERAQKRHQVVVRAKQAGFAIAKTLFTIAAISGIFTVALVAPGIFVAFGKNKGHKKFFESKEVGLKNWLYTNKNRSSLIFTKTDENTYTVSLTERGKQRFLLAEAYRLRLKKEKKWDGKWRIVIFDIPQKNKTLRDVLRRRFKIIGMYQLQKSVFIYPYPCQEEIEFIIGLYNASNYVYFITADKINGLDPELIKYLI